MNQEEVTFYYSKFKSRRTFISSFLSLLVPFAFLYEALPLFSKTQSLTSLLVANQELAVCVFLYFILALWKITESFLEIVDSKAQLKVSPEGVWTKKFNLITWATIKEICVHTDGKSATHSLYFTTNDGSRCDLTIEDFEGYENIDFLIQKYAIKNSIVQSPLNSGLKIVVASDASVLKGVKFLAIGAGVLMLPLLVILIYLFSK